MGGDEAEGSEEFMLPTELRGRLTDKDGSRNGFRDRGRALFGSSKGDAGLLPGLWPP
jgi:hypothetical protein